MNNIISILMAGCLLSGFTACSTKAVYDEPPYESRTAGEGEKLKREQMRQKSERLMRTYRKEQRK